MDCSTPSFPVLHQLPELAQTHVHQVSDATQKSHCLSSPSPPAFNLSQHQGILQWVSSSYQMAKVLEFQLQHELPDVQAGFRKDRGMRDLISNIVGSSNKQENTRKNIYFSFIDYAKVFDCIDHKLWKILQERNTRPSYLPLEKSVCR